MKANTTTRWVTVLVAAWLAVPSVAQGQDRTRRNRIKIEQAVRSSARARVGISLDVRQSRRFDDQGALITDVLRGSPAWDEGLREGDVVTSFRGHVLTETLESGLEDDFGERDALPVQRLLALAREMEPEEIVEIRYTRDGESYVIEVEAEASSARTWFTPGAENFGIFLRADTIRPGRGVLSISPPDFEFSFGGLLNECPGGSNRFWSVGDGRGCVAGVELRELNPTLGEYFGTESGILVIDVDEDNPLGFMPGDVIVSVGDREVDSLARVRRVLGSYEEDETVTVRIIRKGSEVVLRGTLR
ncbi:MAG: PDZ domain-containing protein [Longimicrobiales bacterium]